MQHRARRPAPLPPGALPPAHDVTLFLVHLDSLRFEEASGPHAAVPRAPDDRGDLPALAGLLTPAENERAGKLVRPDDRRGFVAAHALLRIAVADRLGSADPHALLFDFTCAQCGEQHGPPRLVGGASGAERTVSVSLSRTAGLVGVAVMLLPPEPGGPTGVERPDPTRPDAARPDAARPDAARPVAPHPDVGFDLERLAGVDFDGFDDVTLTPTERRALAPGARHSRSQLRARAQLWVRKEAIAKACGTGLRRDPRGIEAGTQVAGARWHDVPLSGPGTADAVAALAIAPAAEGTSITCTIVRAETALAAL